MTFKLDQCPFIKNKTVYDERKFLRRELEIQDGVKYRWWQVLNNKNKWEICQLCSLKKKPEPDFEKCLKSYKKCPTYQEEINNGRK